MTDFSTGGSRLTPKHFSSGPGQVGAQAAMRGAKGGQRAAPPSHGGGKTSPPSTSPKGGGSPAPAPQPDQPEPSDFRHLMAAAQHQNMRQLGRDIPFGTWLLLNGHHRELIPDGHPYDVFVDS